MSRLATLACRYGGVGKKCSVQVRLYGAKVNKPTNCKQVAGWIASLFEITKIELSLSVRQLLSRTDHEVKISQKLKKFKSQKIILWLKIKQNKNKIPRKRLSEPWKQFPTDLVLPNKIFFV